MRPASIGSCSLSHAPFFCIFPLSGLGLSAGSSADLCRPGTQDAADEALQDRLESWPRPQRDREAASLAIFVWLEPPSKSTAISTMNSAADDAGSRIATPPQWYHSHPAPHPPPPKASKVSTVTGMGPRPFGVANLVNVVVFDASKPPSLQLSSL